MIDLTHTSQPTVPDPLFLERFQAFLDKSLNEIKAFSERENMPLEETRRHVAEWHSRYLFRRDLSTGINESERKVYIRSVLSETSRNLESLHTLSQADSFFLIVDPIDHSDEGFLGGTMLGREFWRGLRGGGENGAKNFKAYCLKNAKPVTPTVDFMVPNAESGSSSSNAGQAITSATAPASANLSKAGPSRALKAEVYTKVRDALRRASQNRKAEMKWTNHARLEENYRIRLVGWPPDLPLKNPSALSVGQNQAIMDAIVGGNMRFERIGGEEAHARPPQANGEQDASVAKNISWVYEEAGPSTFRSQSSPTTPGPTQALQQDEQLGPDLSRSIEQHPPMQSQNTLNNNDPVAYLLEFDVDRVNSLARPDTSSYWSRQQSKETDIVSRWLTDLPSDEDASQSDSSKPVEKPSKKRRLDDEEI